MLKDEPDGASTHDEVVQTREACDVGNRVFQRADQVVLQRAQIAAVIQLQKPGAELGHVDLDRALPRAGFTRQAACHRLIDFVRKVLLAHFFCDCVDGSFCDACDFAG
ncbi:hypothetical protein D3C76_1370250 [compost metagenome]